MPLEEYNKMRKLKLLRWLLGFTVVLVVCVLLAPPPPRVPHDF